MKGNKLILILVAVVGLLMLAACGGKEEVAEDSNAEVKSETATNEQAEETKEVYKLKVGHISPDDQAYAIGFKEYAAAVEEATNGQVQFEIFGNGTLGGERELLEGVQLGTLDMSVITTGVVTNFVPEISVIEFPFLFRDLDHVYKTLDGEVGQELLDKVSEQGLKAIAFWENGQRHLSNSKHPIKTPEDLDGLKMRTIESELLLDTYAALGTNATPMAFPEVYGGLQQGVIDGSDFSTGVYWSTKVWEQSKYFSEVGLYYASAVLVINDDLLKSMPEDIQKVIVDLGKEYAQKQRQISQDLEAEQKQLLLDNGVEIINAEDLDIQAFRDKVQPVYEKHAEKYGSYIERIQAVQ
ncbi:TRAP transporter substrate-binding protein DctP [Bacillus sp. Marseille-P3661]|uniref:TRAP transporter substrate-binding protein DctP n=1 Tax=Bacillus sp. Marseille-P3661 TaxID=1936234 RepID=UPI000C827E79|nr:TRAP transporter substrate-binding protein DctP [Bacillus sp. Marseille-P3661]